MVRLLDGRSAARRATSRGSCTSPGPATSCRLGLPGHGVRRRRNRPSWATATSGLWAPDVRYVDGRYVIYFTVTDTTLNPGDDSAIGVATAPTPVGPWTPTDAPVVDPAPGQRRLPVDLRPGRLHRRRRPAPTSTTAATTAASVGHPAERRRPDRRRGGHPGGDRQPLRGQLRRPARRLVLLDGLLGQLLRRTRPPATRCSPAGPGPRSGRSSTPTASRCWTPGSAAPSWSPRTATAGSAPATTPSPPTPAGRDFLVYHALDRNEPWLNEPFGINRRPMLLDRIDWIDGWPRTRAGAGPSETRQPAPVTGSGVRHQRRQPGGARLRRTDRRSGRSAGRSDRSASGHGAHASRRRRRSGARAARPSQPTTDHAWLGDARRGVAVTVDPGRDRLILVANRGGRDLARRDSAAAGRERLADPDRRAGRSRALAQLSESDLGDPYAEVRLAAARARAGRGRPVRLLSRDAVVDNVSIRTLATEARRQVPAAAGRPAADRRGVRPAAVVGLVLGAAATPRPTWRRAASPGRCRPPTWSGPATPPASCCATPRTATGSPRPS